MENTNEPLKEPTKPTKTFSTGAIIGIAAMVLLIIAFIYAFWFWRKENTKPAEENANQDNNILPPSKGAVVEDTRIPKKRTPQNTIDFLILELEGISLTKDELASFYGVDRKTFGKWVYFYCVGTVLHKEYMSLRKLNWSQISTIVSKFGEPMEHGKGKFNKAEIAQICNLEWEQLFAHIKQNYCDYPSKKIRTYTSLNVFPPLVAKRLEETYRRIKSPIRRADQLAKC